MSEITLWRSSSQWTTAGNLWRSSWATWNQWLLTCLWAHINSYRGCTTCLNQNNCKIVVKSFVYVYHRWLISVASVARKLLWEATVALSCLQHKKLLKTLKVAEHNLYRPTPGNKYNRLACMEDVTWVIKLNGTISSSSSQSSFPLNQNILQPIKTDRNSATRQ